MKSEAREEADREFLHDQLALIKQQDKYLADLYNVIRKIASANALQQAAIGALPASGGLKAQIEHHALVIESNCSAALARVGG